MGRESVFLAWHTHLELNYIPFCDTFFFFPVLEQHLQWKQFPVNRKKAVFDTADKMLYLRSSQFQPLALWLGNRRPGRHRSLFLYHDLLQLTSFFLAPPPTSTPPPPPKFLPLYSFLEPTGLEVQASIGILQCPSCPSGEILTIQNYKICLFLMLNMLKTHI